MSDPTSLTMANHLLQSVHRDLGVLKENNFLSDKQLREILALLPLRIESHTPSQKPLLPARRSTSNTRTIPSPSPRQSSASAISSGLNATPLLATSLMTPPIPLATPPPAYDEPKALKLVEAAYDYQGQEAKTDLSFVTGDRIRVTEYVNDDWWKGTLERDSSKSGIFPRNHVNEVQAVNRSPSPKKSTGENPPYSYPPPPTSIYYAPPTSGSTSYTSQAGGAFPPGSSGGSYSGAAYQPPPPQGAATAEEPENNKVKNMAQKFGGHVASAATWGFGATLGSEAARAIF